MAHRTSYHDLIAAAASLVDTGFLDDCESATGEAARAYLSKNRDALGAARVALRNECAVPLRYDQEFYTEHAEDFGPLRSLAKTFALELRQAKLGNDFALAARIGVDLFELSNAVRRGGLVIDFLVSLSMSSMAIEGMRGMRSRLDEPTRSKLRSELARIERSHEMLGLILCRDRKWELIVGWQDQTVGVSNIPLSELETGLPEERQQAVIEALQSMANLPEDEKVSRYRDFENRELAMQRLLFVDLALRSYRATHECYPDSLNSLMPSICNSLPDDPFTNESFRYRRFDTNEFDLYSPGPTRVDHGGVFGHWMMVAAGQADLCLDVGDYGWESPCV